MTNEEKLMLRELYTSANTDQRIILEKLFPELKESEDEKTRKELTEFLKSASEGHLDISTPFKTFGKWLAWFEKQSQNTFIVEEIKRRKELLLREKDKACSSNQYMSICSRIAILGELLAFANKKQSESADKVEPKFKVGDWVVNQFGEAWHIDSFDKKYYHYQVSNNLGGCSYFPINKQDAMRLWTIADAKPDDVLVLSYASKNYIIIYRGLYEKSFQTMMSVFCSYSVEEDIYDDETDSFHAINTGEVIKPATREQRVLLFQKMKEAGYKWENDQLIKIDNNDFVDLGLPSGTIWAKCNLGATKPSDFGKFFQWGDTQGYEGIDEHSFKWGDYKHGSYDDLTKYNIRDCKSELDNEDDPVFVTTNGKFKMPTNGQLQELIDYTNHEWVSIDGVNGMKFINKKDDTKYIFIPAAGVCRYDSHSDIGSLGCVWSTSINESNNNCTWDMYIKEGEVCLSDSTRCLGYSVRGVLNK